MQYLAYYFNFIYHSKITNKFNFAPQISIISSYVIRTTKTICINEELFLRKQRLNAKIKNRIKKFRYCFLSTQLERYTINKTILTGND